MRHHMHTQAIRATVCKFAVALACLERAPINLHADLIRAGSHGRASFYSQNLETNVVISEGCSGS